MDRLLGVAISALLVCGCARPQHCEIDFSTYPPRFVIEHHGWPRPFWTPRVREFAIASDANEDIWQLEAKDPRGEPAKGLTVTYGIVPDGFVQKEPAVTARPPILVEGRKYYVAAGGNRYLYPMVFSLPVDWRQWIHNRSTTQPMR